MDTNSPVFIRIVQAAINAAVRAMGPDATEEEIDRWIVMNRPFSGEVEEAVIEMDIDYLVMIDGARDVARARNPSGLFLVFRVGAES